MYTHLYSDRLMGPICSTFPFSNSLTRTVTLSRHVAAARTVKLMFVLGGAGMQVFHRKLPRRTHKSLNYLVPPPAVCPRLLSDAFQGTAITQNAPHHN